MIKNLISFVPEVKENGYLKINDFISKDDALYLENATMKAFKKAKKEYYHIHTDFVKVLTVNEDLSKKVKYFKFLNEIFNNNYITEFVSEYFKSNDTEITKIFLAEFFLVLPVDSLKNKFLLSLNWLISLFINSNT